MNKIITRFLASAIMVFSAVTVTAAVKVGTLWYELSTDTTAQVTFSSEGEYTGAIVIPASITVDGKTYSVTGIGDRAFYSCEKVTKVVLPSSITTIGTYSFCACHIMESVNLEDTKVTSLPYGAFGACWGLTSVTLPATLTEMDDNPFYMPTSMQSFKVAEGNPAFKAVDGALYTISGKKLVAWPFARTLNVVIPEGTDSIGNETFMNFRSMRTCVLPQSLKYIGRSSFTMCDTLQSINLPSSLVYIGGSAFHGNACMKGKAVFAEGLKSLGASAFNGTAITEVDIPGSCKVISKNAFSGCRSVTRITLHEGTTRLMEMAFYNCKANEIIIPNSVTSIGSGVFSGNNTARKLVIGTGITSFEATPFENCSSLTSIYCYSSTPPSYLAAYARRKPLFPTNVYTTARLHVPEDAISAYKEAIGFSEFTNVLTVGVGEVDTDEVRVTASPAGIEIVGADFAEVFTAAGTKVYAGPAASVELPKGLYIVRADGRSFKIMR